MQKMLWLFTLAALMAAAPAAQAAGTYTIDPAHSTVGFSVPHMMVSTVKGGFTAFDGTIQFDPQVPEQTAIHVVIQTTSIDTRVPDRDKHLRSSDFLDAEQYPAITFQSRFVKKSGEGYLVTGDLTIRGVTRSIDLPLTINGPVTSPFGAEVIGLSGTLPINRQDFGVSWNKTMDQGGLVVGDIVTIEVAVEAQKKPS